ncbi:MAG: hypothetical protein RSE64_05695, partial [Oscillospiraceae bacterium]
CAVVHAQLTICVRGHCVCSNYHTHNKYLHVFFLVLRETSLPARAIIFLLRQMEFGRALPKTEPKPDE